MIDAYCNGLIGGDRSVELMQLEQSLVERAGDKADGADKVDFDGNRFKLQKLDTDKYDTLSVKYKHRRQVEEGIARAVGNRFKVCPPIRRFRKKGGGSGGLIQFRVLLMPKGTGCSKTNRQARRSVQVIDLKPITRPGICGWHHPYPPVWPDWSPAGGLACGTGPSLMGQRVERTLGLERGFDLHGRFPRTLVYPWSWPCLVRARCRQEEGVKVKDLEERGEVSQGLALEADVLGRLHAKSLTAGQAGDLRSKFEAAEGDLVDLARRMAGQVQADFAILKARWPTP